MHTAAAILVPVLGNIGEQREVTECPHHTQRLFDAEPVQFMIELCLKRGNILDTGLAPQRYRQLSNVLDPVENRFAIGVADDIAEQAAERLDFLAQAGIFFILRHGVRAPEYRETSA